MLTFNVRNLSSSKLRALGFNASDHPGMVRFRRGKIVGSYVCNGRFEPGVLKINNLGTSELDLDNAVKDLAKASPVMKVCQHG